MHPFLTSYTRKRIIVPTEDPYWNNVELLCHFDGTNNSTILTDVKGHLLTRGGDVIISTAQSKFGGASAYFDGVADYLMLVSGDILLPDDFTIEYWAYYDRYIGAVQETIYAQSGTILLGRNSSGVVYYPGLGGETYEQPLALNGWHHVALTRQSQLIRVFCDGILLSNKYTRATAVEFTELVNIGQIGRGTGAYLDEVRITKGVARYTSNFSVPTAAYPDSGSGTYDPYWNHVTFHLHCDGIDANTVFNDSKGHTVTPAGNVQIDTAQSKFGEASALFDGNGDYLVVTDSADFDFPGDFTIEAWIYLATTNTYKSIWGYNSAGQMILGVNSGDVYSSVGSGHTITAGMAANTWYHIALTRKAGVVRHFVDGVHLSSGDYTNTTAIGDNGYCVGAARPSSLIYPFNGNIDSLRLTKGIARYTTNFTPPTSAFPTNTIFSPDPFFSNVTLLMHMNGTDGSTTFTDVKGHTITTSGNVQIDTALSKFGGASALFDGSTDYLISPASLDYSLTSDFTVEFWMNADTQNVWNLINIYSGTASTSEWIIALRTQNTTGAYIRFSGYTTFATNATSDNGIITYGEWHHIAITRNGNMIYFFVDGIQFGAPKSFTITPNSNTGTNLQIGRATGVSGDFDGHIDDLRITKGIARYITNFIPRELAFPDS